MRLAALRVGTADDVAEMTIDAVSRQLALDARTRAAGHDARHDAPRRQRLKQVVYAVQQRVRLLGKVGKPSLVRHRPPILRQSDTAEGVVPVGRIRAAVRL